MLMAKPHGVLELVKKKKREIYWHRQVGIRSIIENRLNVRDQWRRI